MQTLSEICAALEIKIIPITRHRRPGETCAERTMERILLEEGEGHFFITLRSIVETTNNRLALVAPVIWAVSDIIKAHPDWVNSGLRWLEAMDSADLVEMHRVAKANRAAVPPRYGIATSLHAHLLHFFPEPQARLL